jgi:Domain of unknown function (DUF4265)
MTKAKIVFPLVRDEDGYPPFDSESVWAELKDGLNYTVDNIPFFARQATIGDVVLVKEVDGEFIFDRIVSRSKSSLIRIIVLQDDQVDVIRSKLISLGCSSELFREPAIIAVDIPSDVNLSTVQVYLSDLEKRDVVTYEEPILRHP